MNRRDFIKFLGVSTAVAAADFPMGMAAGAAGTEATRGKITMTLEGWRAAGQPMHVYDVAVFGGGFSGLGAAFELARHGQRVLIVERGAALGWEATWACQHELARGISPFADELAAMIERAGGMREGLIDGPITEMCLNRMTLRDKIDTLYYCDVVALDARQGRLNAVILAGRAGMFALHARAFVDATEEGVLLARAGCAMTAPADRRGLYSLQLIGTEEQGLRRLPEEVPAEGDRPACHIRKGVWNGDVWLEWEEPTGDMAAARRGAVKVLESIRVKNHPLAAAQAVTMNNLLLPLQDWQRPDAGVEVQGLTNLFGAGPWMSGSAPPNERAKVLARRVLGGQTAAASIAAQMKDLQSAKSLPCTSFHVPVVAAPPCQVLVCGGGTAGALAAIAAARQGASTTLLESQTCLGGTGTAGMIHVYCWGIAGGLQNEVDKRTAALTRLFCPDGKVEGWHPEAKKLALQELAAEAGARVLYQRTVAGVALEQPGNRIRKVFAAGTEGIAEHRAEVVIDSTGDATVAVLAGARSHFGRPSDGMPDPFSQSAGGVSAQGKLSLYNFDAGICDSTDPWDLSRARRSGVDQYWRERFDLEHRLLSLAPQVGVRSTRFIEGDYQITDRDQIDWRQFEDAIGHGYCAMDKHGFDVENESDATFAWIWLFGQRGRGIGCEIPYRALLPQGVEGLLVACRAFSLSYEGHFELRMQRDIQRIGEAAGIAAALAAHSGATPRRMDVKPIQAALEKSGALNRGVWALLRRRCLLRPVDESNIDAVGLELAGKSPNEAALRLTRAGELGRSKLKANLQAGNSRVRFWAEAGLAVMGERAVGAELLAALRERRPEQPGGPYQRRSVPIWISAIVLLGMIGKREAAPLIEDVLLEEKDDVDVLLAALRALERIGAPSSADAILKLLARPNLPRTRALQNMKIYGGVIREDDVAQDVRAEIELACARALKTLGRPQPRLVEPYLNDPSLCTRRLAIRYR